MLLDLFLTLQAASGLKISSKDLVMVINHNDHLSLHFWYKFAMVANHGHRGRFLRLNLQCDTRAEAFYTVLK